MSLQNQLQLANRICSMFFRPCSFLRFA